MNKTININLGGYFFHIDESAYQKLKRYLDAIANSLSDDPQGKNEIIADIEARISELLSERITDSRQVVHQAQIDEIISIMGQPEDYSDGEKTEPNYANFQNTSSVKKLFRDVDDKFLGGVCSGVGHYIGLDPIWLRILMLILTFAGFGSGVIAYIVLWILLPEAKTTAEKLQMAGEPVNIGSIEKKIRKEFNTITDSISNKDYGTIKQKTKSGLQEVIDVIGKVLITLFKIIGKIIGVFLIFIGGITSTALLAGVFFHGNEIININGNNYQITDFINNSTLPNWLYTLFIFIFLIIPFFALLVLGFRMLSSRIKRMNPKISLSLLGLWLISAFGLSYAGIELGFLNSKTGVSVSEQELIYNKEQPLKIAVQNDENIFYTDNLRRRDNAEKVIVNEKESKYSNNVKIDVRKSDTGKAYIKIKKESSGKEAVKASENAKKIDYTFKNNDNEIIFDAYFLSDVKNMWRDEEVELIVYIPEETTIYFENSSKRFLYNIDNTQDIYDPNMANYHFKMTKKGFECQDCEEENPDWNDETEKKKK